MKNKLHNIAILLVCMWTIVSCSDNDSFSLSPSNVLSFETDTLSLDTVFSTVPSPSKQFKVFNLSGDGIRIVNARLLQGNQTGFRVNVNGTYLSPELGYQVNDLELRKGDSLRVFVEMTSLNQKANDPKLVEDNLVFTLESGVQQYVNLNAWSWDAFLLRNLTISSDTTLANIDGKPIVVYDTIRVLPSAKLTIAPGTTLYFHGNAGIDVHGTLVAKGEMDNEITMRCDRLDRMVSNLMYDNNPGQWGGLRLRGNSFDNILEYVDIHSGTTGILCDSAYDKTRQKLTLNNVTIHNMKSHGLYSVNGKIDINNTQISNTQDTCAYFLGGDININNTTIAQYYPFDYNRGPALVYANAQNLKDTTITYDLALRARNTMVKGYEDDVIVWSYGGLSSDTALNVRFENCLLRTEMPTDKDTIMFANMNNIIENPADTLTRPDTCFVQFDTDFFFYDFTPKGTFPAIGNANPETSLPVDRRGKERDRQRPDIGCYESDKSATEQSKE